MGLLHFGHGWLPERKEHSSPQKDVVSPRVFCSTCLSSLGSSAPAAVGCLSPSPITCNQTHKTSFPRVSPPCNIPSSCKPEGTAVSAVSCCCECSFQGCSEDAEEEVCWVLNSSRRGAGRGCCTVHPAVWCTEISASGICSQVLQHVQPAAGFSTEPCWTGSCCSSLGSWVRRGVGFGRLERREKCSFWQGFVLCPVFVQTQVKGGTTTSWQIIYFCPFSLHSPFLPMRLPWIQVK